MPTWPCDVAPSQCLPGSDVIDLIGESGKDLDAYFDRREFDIWSWLEDQHYWHRYRKTVILQILQGHSTVAAARWFTGLWRRGRGDPS